MMDFVEKFRKMKSLDLVTIGFHFFAQAPANSSAVKGLNPAFLSVWADWLTPNRVDISCDVP
jgi:hypothetical protein